MVKEKVQGKMKQHFLYKVPLWNSLSLNLRTANTKTTLDKSGEQDYTQHSRCCLRNLLTSDHWKLGSLE